MHVQRVLLFSLVILVVTCNCASITNGLSTQHTLETDLHHTEDDSTGNGSSENVEIIADQIHGQMPSNPAASLAMDITNSASESEENSKDSSILTGTGNSEEEVIGDDINHQVNAEKIRIKRAKEPAIL